MATFRICDFCGKEIKEEDGGGYKYTTVSNGIIPYRTSVDICKDCYKKLQTMIRTKAFKESINE